MADELPTNESLTATGEITQKVTDAFSLLGKVSTQVGDQINALNDKFDSLKNNFNQNQRTLDNQTTAFGLLTTAALGTRQSFENLAGIDSSGLNTFTGQIQDMQQLILKDSSLDTVAKKAKALGDAFNISGTLEEVLNYTNNLAASADNALKLQNAFVQLSAKTGNLTNVYKTAGDELENINLLLEQQQQVVSSAAAATGTSQATVEQYYAMLGTVPQALNASATGADGVESSVSMLTATMQLAVGAGRKYSDVVEDLKVAFKNYNLTGDEALQFTARMGEISNKYGIELDDVQSALRSTANEFKYFGNAAEGAANLMNQYVGALQKTGVSGTVAVDMVKNITSGIKDLNVAQKGFLSAQTGGPGGLMGAFQIEKELREGKIDKVFDKVRQSMSKQFGKIVSLEEASQSQAAAAQLTKQIMILRQGPLGQFAKSDQEAIRVLEGFKTVDQGGTASPLSETQVEDVQKIGVEINKKSYTELSRIRALIETARGSANVSNKGFVENAFAAGIGQEGSEVDPNHDARANINEFMKTSASVGARTAENSRLTINGDQDGIKKQLTNKGGESVAETINNVAQFAKDVPKAAQAPLSTVKSLFNQNRSNEIAEEENKKKVMNDIALSNDLNSSLKPEYQPQNRLGGIAKRVADSNQENAKAATTTAKETVTTSASEVNGKITVQVEGFCLDCGDKIKGHNHSMAIAPSQRAKI